VKLQRRGRKEVSKINHQGGSMKKLFALSLLAISTLAFSGVKTKTHSKQEFLSHMPKSAIQQQQVRPYHGPKAHLKR
jgi:hypothetical protein